MAKCFAISLPTWEEHQERPDRANYVWFKVYQKMLTGSFWRMSTLQQKAMWFALMCLRNNQEQNVLLVPDFVLAGHCGEGVKINEIQEILSGLDSLGVIQDESGQFPGKAQEFARPRNRNLELEKEKNRKPPANSRRYPIDQRLVGEYSSQAKDLLEMVHSNTQEAWLAAYPDPAWIKQEVNKAAGWISANQRKAPKNFGSFMGKWLSRGWESFRKTIPSASTGPSAPINYDKVFGRKGAV